MLTYRRSMLLLLIPLFVAFTTAAFAQAEKGKSKVITAKADKTSSDLDEAVKAVSRSNDPNATPPKPPDKGGTQTKGSGGYTKIVNYTPWYIDIYARIGETWYWEGAVTPYGNLWVYTGSLCADFYGSASDIGLHWGTSYVCSDTWELTRGQY